MPEGKIVIYRQNNPDQTMELICSNNDALFQYFGGLAEYIIKNIDLSIARQAIHLFDDGKMLKFTKNEEY